MCLKTGTEVYRAYYQGPAIILWNSFVCAFNIQQCEQCQTVTIGEKDGKLYSHTGRPINMTHSGWLAVMGHSGVSQSFTDTTIINIDGTRALRIGNAVYCLEPQYKIIGHVSMSDSLFKIIDVTRHELPDQWNTRLLAYMNADESEEEFNRKVYGVFKCGLIINQYGDTLPFTKYTVSALLLSGCEYCNGVYRIVRKNDKEWTFIKIETGKIITKAAIRSEPTNEDN